MPELEPRPGCHLCPDDVARSPVEMLNHFRVLHPAEYGDGPERWPDGGIVIYEDDPEPADAEELP
jgi:hypothetical protein